MGKQFQYIISGELEIMITYNSLSTFHTEFMKNRRHNVDATSFSGAVVAEDLQTIGNNGRGILL